jgi:hypothetical protein
VSIAGETNAGKTTLANFLIEAQLLATDVLPNTPCPALVRFGDTACVQEHRVSGEAVMHSMADLHRLRQAGARLIEVFLPSAVLRTMEILDWPGLRSGQLPEEQRQLWDTADVVLWCTVGTQAWKASEEATWRALSVPPARALLVVTNRDLISPAHAGDVLGRLDRETSGLFSATAAIATPLAISARNPRGQITDEHDWKATGAQDFMKKLMERIHSALVSRAPSAPVPAHAANGVIPARPPKAAAIAAPAFTTAKTQILAELSDEHDTARQSAIILSGLKFYLEDKLHPWLMENSTVRDDVDAATALFPRTPEDIETVLAPQPGTSPITPAAIVNQIEAELNEAFQRSHPRPER